VGQSILLAEKKAKQEEVAHKKRENQKQWTELYWAAVRALPREIAKYLKVPVEVETGNTWSPLVCSNYYHWQLKIQSMVPIEVRFGDRPGKSEEPIAYIVPLAEPFYDGAVKETTRTFSGDHALECALAFAVGETIALRKLEAERERLAKEYEEREALESREPKYEPVDGSEPVPDLVLVAGVRRMIQEELKKAGVLS
jgi:hypothetical protein